MIRRFVSRPFRVAGAATVALALLALLGPQAGATVVTGDPNPPWPDKCGVDAALLIDHSNSIMLDDAANPGLLKDAAKSFADALAGTPSRMAVHSFWKTAQQEIDWTDTNAAGVSSVKAAIDTIPFSTSSPNGSTNWDEAFRSVEDVGAEIVIILTDGNPTVHLGTYDTGGTTQQADIDEGVSSANRVKSQGLDGIESRIVAVGIGGGVSVANLQLISGPNADDDYFTTDFDSLKNMLIDIPMKFCGGSVTVEKVAQNADGSFSPTSGWAFTTSLENAPPPTITADPTDGHTNGAGLATFSWKSTGTEVATVVEAARAGYALQSVTCKEGDDPFPTESVERGLKLTLGPTDNVKCVFRNARTNPAINVEKSATPTLAGIGETVDYDFTVTNTGNLRLTNVTLLDDRLGPITLADTTLDPNESTTGTASHVVALADLPGPHVNVATATGTPPTGPTVSDTDDASVALKTAPAISMVKSGPVKAHFGDAVTYGFAVTNTGDVPLTDVSVDDDKLGHIGTIATLAVDETKTVQYHTTAPANDVTNVATACGTDPLDKEVCDTDDHTIDVINPAITVVKTGAAKAHAGDDVTYSFAVTNNGDVALTNVSVDDDKLGHIGDLGNLAVGETKSLTKTSSAPANDVTNVATACGIDPLDEDVCDNDDHIVDVIHPAITVVKTGADQAHAGDEYVYSFAVTNSGDVALTNVSVEDDVYGSIGTIASLAVDQTQTLTKTVSAPASDTRNVATACGLDPLQDETCDTDDHIVDVINPGIDVTKTAAEFAHEGDEITYTFRVHNTGDVALAPVTVADDVLGEIATIPSLAGDATAVLTKTMTVPASTDAVDNEATACGLDPLSDELCDTDIHHLTVIHPAIAIDKKVAGGDHKPSGDALAAHEGDDLGYTVAVTNTGDTALEITALSDILEGALDGCSQGTGSTLEPAGVITCSYTTTASEDHRNEVFVTGMDRLGGDKGTVNASDETFVNVVNPAIEIVKTASPVSVEPGQETTFTYEVTNTGDTTLTDVVVTDDILGDIGTILELAPGETTTLTKTVTIEADSPRTNVGTACGIDEARGEVCASDEATISIVLPLPPEARLPATGFRLLLWLAFATTLIAAGLAMVQTQRRSRSV